MANFSKIGVVGAGQMGAALAAHFANSGLSVALLDIVPEGATNRNVLAESAIKLMLKGSPAPFMHPQAAELIIPGNLEDDLHMLSDADWICEALVENLKIKQDIYRAIESIRRAQSIVSSNTSTIPLTSLTSDMPKSFVKDFAITHFFNPPRYMQLVEIIPGPETHTETIRALQGFCELRLGKEVIIAKDTPGFIANRIGIYWYYVAMSKALELGLTVEEADAVMGPAVGIPKTGIFGLIDLTGIDLAPKVNATLLSMLPFEDRFVQEFNASGPLAILLKAMIDEGFIGRKGKGGFYRMVRSKGSRELQARNLSTGEYRAVVQPLLNSLEVAKKSGLRALLEYPDKGGQYAWQVLSQVLTYAASLIPDVADDIVDIDRAMTFGYGWQSGPFEMIDKIGVAWFTKRLRQEKRPVPTVLHRANGKPLYHRARRGLSQMSIFGSYKIIKTLGDFCQLSEIKSNSERIFGNNSASLWDIGDKVACLEFHSKMNVIDDQILAMIMKAAAIHERGYEALVIGNDGKNFSIGARMDSALFLANAAMWSHIEEKLKEGQKAVLGLKYAPFPVVGAASGMSLGGGCEILMHCDAVQAHAETYIGLVESGIGLIPSWGGCKELIMRAFSQGGQAGGPMPKLINVFETISMAKVSNSAREAQELLFLGDVGGVTMHRRRLLMDAKALALGLLSSYVTPSSYSVAVPGPSGKAALGLIVSGLIRQGSATKYDGVVADALAEVLTGGDTDITDLADEEYFLTLERLSFMSLIQKPQTLDRIEWMLAKNKALRN